MTLMTNIQAQHPVTPNGQTTEEDINKVRSNLWIGSLQGTSGALHNKPSLFARAVSCIEICPELRQGIGQLHISVGDVPSASLLEHFSKSSNYIHQALKNDERIIVHCEMGISRSAALVAAYLIKHENMDVKQALRTVYSARPKAHVNPWFVKNLVQWWQDQAQNLPSEPVKELDQPSGA